MQAERQPSYPLLHSLPGFRYCDLLLTSAERAAGQMCMGSAGFQPVVSGILPENRERAATGSRPAAHEDPPPRAAQDARRSGQDARAPLLPFCRAVSERAAQTLPIAERNNWLLDIALNHLTLGRAALYAAVLSSDTAALSSFSLPTSHLAQSVSGLRRAGQQQYLPIGLLTRAWQRNLTGWRTGPESAQSDLDEAWEIAARGPMPLFLADIHLYRARLFGEAGGVFSVQSSVGSGETYPWESPQADLAEARRLIVKHGYLRRMGELEDAEAALGTTEGEG